MNSTSSVARELVDRVIGYLAEHQHAPRDLVHVARALDVSPKLLASIPPIRSLLTEDGMPAVLDWTVRDWLLYHYYLVHQGYRYGFPELQPTWRGRVILKNPLDCWVYQEIIHRTRPDVLLELGVAFGGSAQFFGDMFELEQHGEVLGIDVSLERAKGFHHPRVRLIEGSSTDPTIIARVHDQCRGLRIMVFADSNHAAEHVLGELEAYADLVGVDMYFIVEDTLADVLQLMPVPIGGPLEAVNRFLNERTDFVLDTRFAERYLMSQSPHGFLRRVI